MAKITLRCSECATELAVEESQLGRAAEKGIACPLCGTRFPLPGRQDAAGGPEKTADGMFRIRCAACAATLNVTEEAFKRLAGRTISCLKCNAEIKISAGGTVLTPPAALSPAQAAAAPAAVNQKDATVVLPPPSVAARQAEAASRPAATVKKCFTCGKILDPGEDALCANCKQKQAADRLVMNVPVEGRMGPKTVKLKVREEQVAEMRTCVKCRAEFLAELNVCPACNTDQTTGKKVKQKRVVAVWPQPGGKSSVLPGGRFMAKLANFGLKLLILAALAVLIYYIYTYIAREYSLAEKEYNNVK